MRPLLTLVLAAALGCTDANQCGGATCGANQACIADTCRDTCEQDADCDADMTCWLGACMDDDTTPSSCGDGEVDDGELCDDGNSDNTDDCLDTCVPASCGDGFVRTGHETCDDGNSDNTDDCLDTCVAAACGDGVVWAGHEWCDDGNQTLDDHCPDGPGGTCANAVTPVYPSHAGWNDYVRVTDPDAGIHHQPEVTCDGTETGYDACLHGGELRELVLADQSSCAGLTLHEMLGAFEWTCDDNNGLGPVVFATTGLAPDHGLRDLVDSSGFRTNSVSVDGPAGRVAQSNPAVWWDNLVVPLPANAGGSVSVLDQAGTIYVLAASANTAGYNLDADRVAVVGLDGVALTWTSTSANCDLASGETPGASMCVLAAGGQRFLWIEIDIADPTGDTDHLVLLNDVDFSRVHACDLDNHWAIAGVRLRDGADNNRLTRLDLDNSGLNLYDAHYNEVWDLEVRGPPYEGLSLELANDNVIRGVRASSGGRTGVLLYGSSRNHLSELRVASFGRGLHLTHNGDGVWSWYNTVVDVAIANIHAYGDWDGEGIRVGETSRHNTLVGLLVTGAERRGIYDTASGHRNTYSHVTLANHGERGFVAGSGIDDLTLVQVLTTNNNGGGVHFFGATNWRGLLSHIWTTNNVAAGLSLYDTSDYVVTGHLWVGNNDVDCYLGGTTTNPPVVQGTCSEDGTEGSHLFNDDPTSAILHPGRDLTSSFVGKVTTDTTNTDHTSGTAAFDDIQDWLGHDSWYRGWGRDGGAFPASGQRGACDTGETCRIWDWRPRADDTQVRNANGAFVDGAACPASVDGTDGALTDQVKLEWYPGINAVEISGDAIGDDDGACESGEECQNVFVDAAQEVLHDGTGDDDGLCESGETCIYSPNVGTYQGQGGYTSCTCVFQDGTVAGVTMHAYPINGQ